MTNILISRSSAITSNWAIDEVKQILNRKDMRVAILGFSFFGILTNEQYEREYGKNSEYQAKMVDLFKEFKIDNVIWIPYFGMDLEEMKNVINKSDVLYLPGGAPDLMMERIVEKGLLDIIKSYNKITIGSSAGAMIQLKEFHISPDSEYSKFSKHQGLGYIDNFYIEVHFRRRIKQKSSIRKMRKENKKPIYIIPDDGMLVVSDGNIKTFGTAKQYMNSKGIYK